MTDQEQEQDQPNTSDEFFAVLALAVVGISTTLLIGMGLVLWLV